MDRKKYPKADKLFKGSWQKIPHKVQGSDDWGGDYSVMFMCTNGHLGILDDHSIMKDGCVVPSVVCPNKGCDFHEHIILEGWEE